MPPSLTHTPVLLQTVLDVLVPAQGETVLDVTLGLGGHAEAFLKMIGDTGHLTALDADPDNLALAASRLQPFEKQTTLIHANFHDIAELSLPLFDIIFADLGLSSPHLDDPSRGFSFRSDGPLDLRFDRTQGKTAAELVESLGQQELVEIFRLYGELYKEASKLARMLKDIPCNTTQELRAIVEKGFGHHAKVIMAQVFQALRIAVNNELVALGNLLQAAPYLLKPNGRFGVLSYHSLEDRMVKQSFKTLVEPEKDDITGRITKIAPFILRTKKAIQASEEEMSRNPRARSVKFRAIQRLP